jgi:DNA modification methylase
MNWLNKTHVGDCRELLKRMADDGVRVQTCVTSPPYFGLRDYGVVGQIGLEPSPNDYVAKLVAVFAAVRDVLADDGTLWLNLGDSYARYPGNRNARYGAAPSNKSGYFENQRQSTANRCGIKAKDLLGIPWRVAFALQADGWYLRSDVIWHKPNPMPESVTDRPTKAHEYLFLLSANERYYYDAQSIAEPAVAREPGEMDGGAQCNPDGSRANVGRNFRKQGGHGRRYAGFNERYFAKPTPFTRNRRTVWSIPTTPFKGAHFATFPRALVEPCILAGSRAGDAVLDPFMGSGTTAQVATDLGRNFLGCELNPRYVELHALRRTTVGMPW